MDMSHRYVLMCKTAYELQSAWKPCNGDLCFIKAFNSFHTVWIISESYPHQWQLYDRTIYLPEDIAFYGIVWMPRAEQCIAMAEQASVPVRNIRKMQSASLHSLPPFSKEQNALQEYMKSVHNKKWINRNWSTTKYSHPAQRRNHGIQV